MSSTKSPVSILLVEDNPLDARATLRAAERLKLSNSIHHVEDGQAAIDYLNQCPASELPDLVLLDLDLPGIDGHGVLKELRSTDRLRLIPVVVLTSSDDEGDILTSYDEGANAFVTKPVGLEGWVNLVQQIDGFWFSVVQIPPEPRSN